MESNESRVAAIAIIVEDTDSVEALNALLHEYGKFIIGRMGVPYRARGINIITIAIDAPQDEIAALTGKIGALGMDTVEGDEGIIHADHRVDILPNRNWFYLHQFRNVIMTQHMAFYTDAAVSSMVACGIGGICQMAAGEPCPTELTK